MNEDINLIILEKQNLKYLKWSQVRSSSGTAGTFLKSESIQNGKKVYYKLSCFDSEKGIVGHECVNEIIVDRLLDVLGVEHLSYDLIHADIEIDGKLYDTYVCASYDFKRPKESKTSLENYYQINIKGQESHYEFCVRNGFKKYIDTMIAVDYLIQNRDRHGANIEVLADARNHTVRIAPLFDHGVSLLFSCINDEDVEDFDVMRDRVCQNFIGSRSTLDNLKYIDNKEGVFANTLKYEHKEIIMRDIDSIIGKTYAGKIWDMIWQRWCYYESLCNI